MTSPVTRFCTQDFQRLKDQLVRRWAVDPKDIAAVEPKLKVLHKSYLSLACTATIMGLRKKPNEHIQGVVECCYLCVVLATKGAENVCFVLLRQSLELVLKHLFFACHPVEYEWASTREGYRELGFAALVSFFSRTDECAGLDPDEWLRGRLKHWHAILSRYVHVHSRRFLGYSKVGSCFRPDQETVQRIAKAARELWGILAAVLVVYFPERYHRASGIEKRLIRQGMPKKVRGLMDRYLRTCA